MTVMTRGMMSSDTDGKRQTKLRFAPEDRE